jgi:hypothetical protein
MTELELLQEVYRKALVWMHAQNPEEQRVAAIPLDAALVAAQTHYGATRNLPGI